MFDVLNLLTTNLPDNTANTIAIVIDVVIVVLLLIFLIRGFLSGFIDAILKLVGTIGALLVAIFCAKPVASFLNGLIGINSWFNGIGAGLCSGDALTTIIETETQRQAALTAINDAGFISFIGDFLKNIVSSMPLGEISVAQAVDASISTILAIIVTGILLFVAVKIIVFLLGKLFDSVDDKRGGKSGVDRLLGSILGLAKGALCVVVMLVIATFMNYVNLPVDQVVQKTYIAKPAYTLVSDKVTQIIDDIDFNSIIDDLISDDGGSEPEGE